MDELESVLISSRVLTCLALRACFISLSARMLGRSTSSNRKLH